MRRTLTLLMLLAAAPFVLGQDDEPRKARTLDLPPFDRTPASMEGLAGRTARVAVTGNGRSALAVYVYDTLGNCVAFDDAPSPVFDDRIASWVPAASGIFEFEIRNVGPTFNTFELSAK